MQFQAFPSAVQKLTTVRVSHASLFDSLDLMDAWQSQTVILTAGNLILHGIGFFMIGRNQKPFGLISVQAQIEKHLLKKITESLAFNAN